MDGVRLFSLSEGIAVLPASHRPFAVSWRQRRARGATAMHLGRLWLPGEPQRGFWGPAYCPSQAADAASCSPTPFVPSAAANVCVSQAVAFHFASCFKDPRQLFQDPYSRPR